MCTCGPDMTSDVDWMLNYKQTVYLIQMRVAVTWRLLMEPSRARPTLSCTRPTRTVCGRLSPRTSIGSPSTSPTSTWKETT